VLNIKHCDLLAAGIVILAAATVVVVVVSIVVVAAALASPALHLMPAARASDTKMQFAAAVFMPLTPPNVANENENESEASGSGKWQMAVQAVFRLVRATTYSINAYYELNQLFAHKSRQHNLSFLHV